MATEFFVIMVKRNDDKIYADLHKSPDNKFYLNKFEAQERCDGMNRLNMSRGGFGSWQVVPLVALTNDEWRHLI